MFSQIVSEYGIEDCYSENVRQTTKNMVEHSEGSIGPNDPTV